MADQLATPEDLAALLQQDLDRSTAELLLECATAIVQQACGQRIMRATSTIILAGTHERWLYLPQRPVVSVATVTLAGTELAAEDWQLSGHWLYRANGWIDVGTALSVVEVEYTHGYDEGDQRLQLARAATLALAAGPYHNPTGSTREQIGDYSVAYEATAARLDASPHLRLALMREYGTPASTISVG